MLKDANYLFNSGYMSLHALSDRIVSRSPSEIRIALFNLASSVKNMFDFSKAAETVIPLAYGREGTMNAIAFHKNVDNHPPNYTVRNKTKYCELHGKIGHSTEECTTLKKLQRLGWEKKKSAAINKVELADKDPLQEIKDSLYFSSYDLPISSNPFIKTAKILGNSIPLLIDTGADLSLVSKHILPPKKRKFKE